EVATAVVLLTGAGLLLRSVRNMAHADLGFDPKRLLVTSVTPPRDARDPLGLGFNARMMEALGHVAGVSSVAGASRRPLQGPIGTDSRVLLEHQSTGDAAHNPIVNCETVNDGYFRTMSIGVLAGRIFDARDRESTLPVMVVSESLARRAWPGQDPLGQRVRVEAFDYGQAPIWWTIVGVVKNVRYRSIESPSFDVYVSAVQSTD